MMIVCVSLVALGGPSFLMNFLSRSLLRLQIPWNLPPQARTTTTSKTTLLWSSSKQANNQQFIKEAIRFETCDSLRLWNNYTFIPLRVTTPFPQSQIQKSTPLSTTIFSPKEPSRHISKDIRDTSVLYVFHTLRQRPQTPAASRAAFFSHTAETL